MHSSPMTKRRQTVASRPPTHRASQLASRVFGITELLEQILSILDPADASKAQGTQGAQGFRYTHQELDPTVTAPVPGAGWQ